MFIAFDIGNTHTVVGLYKKDNLLSERRIASVSRQTEDDINAQVQSFFDEYGINFEEIDGAGISSVVPDLTEIYASICRLYLHRVPLIISAKLDLGIAIHYSDPNSLGADRLCNTIAGYTKYGGPLIIIDFGTATTFDVVASNGDYLGGVIAPGIETSAAGLHMRTAKLPGIELKIPAGIICTDTISGIQAGVTWGAIDSAAGMVNRIQKELVHKEKKNALVIATGGFSGFIAEHSKTIQHIEPHLVIDGIRLIYERIKRKEQGS